MNNEQILAAALAPKSDQLNADDLIVKNLVIHVTKVLVNLQSESQKIVVHYVGDNGKPWKPSKSMGRVLAEILGGDFASWEGQYIELFKNKEITFGKDKCGGIQIAAMSALRNPVTIMITTKRSVKSKITIMPLLIQQPTNHKAAEDPALKQIATALQAASKLGVLALNTEAALIPEKYREPMLDWLAKCVAHAKHIDSMKAAQEQPIDGFKPLVQSQPEHPPTHTEAYEDVREDGSIEDL